MRARLGCSVWWERSQVSLTPGPKSSVLGPQAGGGAWVVLGQGGPWGAAGAAHLSRTFTGCPLAWVQRVWPCLFSHCFALVPTLGLFFPAPGSLCALSFPHLSLSSLLLRCLTLLPSPHGPPPSSSLSNPPLQFIFLPFLPHCFLCTTSFLLPTPRPPGNWRETRHYPAEVSPHPRTPGPHPLLPHHPTLTAGSQLCPAALGSKVECQGWACTR